MLLLVAMRAELSTVLVRPRFEQNPAFNARACKFSSCRFRCFLALIRGVVHRSLPVFGAFPVAWVDALKSRQLDSAIRPDCLNE